MVLRNKEIKKIDKLTKKCDFHGFTSSSFRLQKSSVSPFLSFSTSLWLQMISSGFSARLQFLLMRKISFYRHQKKKFYD